MPLLLNVPFVQKDEAKALGARWNPELKTWYVSDRNKYSRFSKWLHGNVVVCNYIYVVEGTHTCFKCDKETQVIGFGFDTYFGLEDPNPDVTPGCVHIGTIDSKLPKSFENELKERYGFGWHFSPKDKTGYYVNHCQNCSAKQGNYYLFDEVESPFFIEEETAENLILHKIRLQYDIVISATICCGSEDHLIKKCATIVESDMQWK